MLARNKVTVALAIILVLTLVGGIVALSHLWGDWPADTSEHKFTKIVRIDEKSPPCEALKTAELVTSGLLCRIYSTLFVEGQAQPGQYVVRSSWSPKQVFIHINDRNNSIDTVKRQNFNQKWYVDVLGPGQDYDLVKKLKAKLQNELFDREWIVEAEGSDIVEVGTSGPMEKSVIFFAEDSDKRIADFRTTSDKVFLFRVWLKRVDDKVAATFSAFQPPAECIGQDMEQSFCKNWQRTVSPGMFQFNHEKAIDAVFRKLQSIPFTTPN